ncbi:hypothetical protein HCN44_010502 [Aphidius gifuensis]|uniref:Odorant-binding protein n=1 Tax=Aphidius gifuensis TaxID=684658 RepID=A0A834XT29_APHGI|nr:mediator of RNA polymerase II transcription subunit 13-like [Aphidius gifuensis]KAF7991701.1 hypothetical protein HCN44_010502 [Aphidius gifuensis]
MMSLFPICITLVGLFVKSRAECYCGADSLLNDLNYRVDRVDEIIDIIQKRYNTHTQQQYNYEQAIERAKTVLNKLDNMKTNTDDDDDNDDDDSDDTNDSSSLPWQQDTIIDGEKNNPLTRRFIKEDGKKWNKQFYKAFAKVLEKEFVKQPAIHEHLGDNFDVHKYVVKEE